MLKAIHTDQAPAAVGPYSQAIKAGNFIYISGQLPMNPETKELYADIEEATRRALQNAEAILSEAGAALTDVVKTTVLLNDINDFAAMNGVYAEFFSDHKPARAAFEVAKLPLGAVVEIELIAYVD